MNTALIQHLESLPKTHLETHIAAYPWFAVARAVLAKKQNSPENIQQTIPYIKDRTWFKNYLTQKEMLQVEEVENKKTIADKIKVEADKTDEIKPPQIEEEKVEVEKVELAMPNSVETFTTKVEELNYKVQEIPIVQEKIEISEPKFSTPATFSDWLQHFSPSGSYKEEKKSTVYSQIENTESDELNTLIQSSIPYEVLESKIEEETHYSKGLSDFISEQKKRKKHPVSSSDFDKNSQLPITETIAILLEKQGKIKQAITIYEQLSLKFPHKSTYFAPLIQKLKQKLN